MRPRRAYREKIEILVRKPIDIAMARQSRIEGCPKGWTGASSPRAYVDFHLVRIYRSVTGSGLSVAATMEDSVDTFQLDEAPTELSHLLECFLFAKLSYGLH